MYTQTSEAVRTLKNKDVKVPETPSSASDNFSALHKDFDVSTSGLDSEQMSDQVNVNIEDNISEPAISETVKQNSLSFDSSKNSMSVHEQINIDRQETINQVDLSNVEAHKIGGIEMGESKNVQSEKVRENLKPDVKLPKQPKPKTKIMSNFKPKVSISC